MEKEQIDYRAFIGDKEVVREKIQTVIDSLGEDEAGKNLLVVQKLNMYTFIRHKFAYCHKYDDGKYYTPEVGDPDPITDLFLSTHTTVTDRNEAYAYICCLMKDAINDYYRNLERFRTKREECTEDWQNSGMSLQEFEAFYSARALSPRRLIKRIKNKAKTFDN